MKKSLLFLCCLIVVFSGSVAKGIERPRLLVMGDSLTVGLFATSEQNGFKHLLASELDADLGSCYGPGLIQIIGCWQNYQTWQPDIVVIEIGLNDVSNPQQTNTEWRSTYAALVAQIQATGADVVLTTMFHGVSASHPNYATYELYNQHIATVAANRGTVLADVWQVTEDCLECISQPGIPSPFAPYWAGDNFHPSDAGHELIAQTIYQAMQNYTYLPSIQGGTIGYP